MGRGISSKLILEIQNFTMRPWKGQEQSSPAGTASVLDCHIHHWNRGSASSQWGKDGWGIPYQVSQGLPRPFLY